MQQIFIILSLVIDYFLVFFNLIFEVQINSNPKIFIFRFAKTSIFLKYIGSKFAPAIVGSHNF